MQHRLLAIITMALLTIPFFRNEGWGQVTVTTHTVVQTTGATQFDKLLFVPEDFQPTVQKVALVKLTTKVNNPSISVTDENRSSVPYEKLSLTEVGDNGTTTYYVVSRPGKNWFSVFGVDFDAKAFINEQVDFTLGPPPPPPKPPVPPGPNPDELPKDFDGIAGKVAEWSKGLSANDKIGAVYLKYSKLLLSNDPRFITIGDIQAGLIKDLRDVPEYNNTYASTFGKSLQTELDRQWKVAPFSKGVYSDFLRLVALGLGVK